MSTGKQKKYIRHPDKYIRNPDKPFVSAFLPGFKNEDFSGSFISVIFTDFPEKSLTRTEKIEKNFNPGLQKQKILAYYGMFSSGRSSVVEHHVANVMVEGSNPFTRSISFSLFSQSSERNVCTFSPEEYPWNRVVEKPDGNLPEFQNNISISALHSSDMLPQSLKRHKFPDRQALSMPDAPETQQIVFPA